ncbi:hypothetical protein [Embleya sp. AB8]
MDDSTSNTGGNTTVRTRTVRAGFADRDVPPDVPASVARTTIGRS